MLAYRTGMLVLEPIVWRRRRKPWEISPDVAFALGRFFRAGAVERDSELLGPAHGDCAPWNLLRGDAGWMFVDWEAYREDAPPFYDLFHHVVQTYATLGLPDLRELSRGLEGKGWLGDAVKEYASGADLPVADARRYFTGYLRAGSEDALLMKLVGPTGVRVRKLLLDSFRAA
jgi:hypothetical protein